MLWPATRPGLLPTRHFRVTIPVVSVAPVAQSIMDSKQDACLRALFAGLPSPQLLALTRLFDDDGHALVHRAAAAGDTHLLQSVLAADPAALKLPDAAGRHPLDVAVAELQPAAAQLLCSQHASGEVQAAAQLALALLLSRLNSGSIGGPRLPPPSVERLEPTLCTMLAAGACLSSATTSVGSLGPMPLLCAALYQQHYVVAEALLRCGAAAHCFSQPLQPLHALALGLARSSYIYPVAAPPLVPEQALSVARQLVHRGAVVDAVLTSPAGDPDLPNGWDAIPAAAKESTTLAYLCEQVGATQFVHM